jgi:hypothetical protein
VGEATAATAHTPANGERAAALLEFLAGRNLRLVNTFGDPEGGVYTRRNWNGTCSAQIDFLAASIGMEIEDVGVDRVLDFTSDHSLVWCVAKKVKSAKFVQRRQSLRNWCPDAQWQARALQMECGFHGDWDEAVLTWYDLAKETRLRKECPRDQLLDFLLKVRRFAPQNQKWQANRSIWRHRRKMKRQNQKSRIMEAAKVGTLPVSTQGGLHVNWKTLFQGADPRQAIADYYVDIYSLDTVDILSEEAAKSDVVSAWKVKAAAAVLATGKNGDGSVVTWGSNPQVPAIKNVRSATQNVRSDTQVSAIKNVRSAIQNVRPGGGSDVSSGSGSASAGVQQIYSTGAQHIFSTGGAYDFDVKDGSVAAADVLAGGENVDGSVVTWGRNPRDAHILAGVRQQIYYTHEVFDSSGSVTAGVQQIYSTGVQQTTSTGGAADSDFDVKDGSVVTWGVNDRDAHFLAGVQQQIYSTHEVFDSSGSISAGSQQIYSTGVQQTTSTRGASDSDFDVKDGSVVTWGVNDRDAHFLAGVQQQIYSTHEVFDSSGSFSAGIQQTDAKLEGAQQIYSTRKHGMMQDGSAVTWGVNERGDVCLSNVCSQIFEAPCQHAKAFLTREKKSHVDIFMTSERQTQDLVRLARRANSPPLQVWA